jgi:antitoxin (DNA-binding transcriptional repressor) of toxin-antitoxin stability system
MPVPYSNARKRVNRRDRPTTRRRSPRWRLVMATTGGYVMAMKAVNVAELKNRLSHYLRIVRRGESILVRDRDRVIARLEPAGSTRAGDDESARLADLELRGIVRRARGSLTADLLRRRPQVKANVVRALLDERDDTR